jgi:hypothetical protein
MTQHFNRRTLLISVYAILIVTAIMEPNALNVLGRIMTIAGAAFGLHLVS